MRNNQQQIRDNLSTVGAAPSTDYYNDEVGRMYVTNPNLFMFSPAFCRCEGQTHLFSQWVSGQARVKRSYLTSLLRFFGKLFRDVAFSMLSKAQNLGSSPGQGVFVFSYFDFRNNDNGTLREEYFRNILNGNQDVHCFYKLQSPGFLVRGKHYLRLLASLQKTFFAYPEHSFISLSMILKAAWLTLLHWPKFGKTRFDGVDAALLDLLRSAHLREIYDGTVYSGYVQKLLFEKILRHRPKTILCVWENSPWERILEHTKKRISPSSISKGFQHTGFSKKLLQHYPSPFESGLDTYPDYILCNGYVNRDELRRNASISSRIIVGGALRQDTLLRKGIGKLDDLLPWRPMRVAYAFSWDRSTYEQILRDLELLPDEVIVYLKFHPDYPEWLDKKGLPRRFINSRASWADIGSVCPLVLANDNSLMFEGFYHGMHTAIYDGVDSLWLEKRDFGSPIAHLMRSDLRMILSEEVINRINKSTHKVLQTRYLERYFVQRELIDLKTVFVDV